MPLKKHRLNKLTQTSLAIASLTLLSSSSALAVGYEDVGQLIWQDNFDSLNSEHWNIDQGNGCAIGLCGWGNQELQSYSENNVSIQPVAGEPGNNALVLSARKETLDDRSFTSGKVQSENKIAVQYGLIEMRIKVPNLDTGLWPAAWMLGTSTLPWPNKGEIDMMEMGHHLSHREGWLAYNSDPNDDGDAAPDMNNFTGSNLIFYAEGACSDANPTCAASVAWQNDNAHVSATPMNDRFVTYRTYWTEQEIRFTIVDNGVEYDMFNSSFGLTGDMTAFQAPFYLLMNLAVGGTFTDAATDNQVTAPIPADMLIDYVRIYELDGQGTVTIGDQRPLQSGTFGVFTDNSPTNNKLEPGVTSDVFLWDPNSSEGNETPFEGDNAISWSFDNPGTWFGGGVQARQALNMSNFGEGDGELSFQIKIPADVSFRIGITDTYTNQNWVTFPAGETTYGLVRNGQWGKVTIPIDDIRGTTIALQSIQYPFAIASDAANLPSGTFEYAIDDILWTGGGEVIDSDGDGLSDELDACPTVFAQTDDGCPDITAVSVRIEAEDYDAFSDTGSGNNGNQYRDDDVDIQATSDDEGNYNVGWTAAGEWLEYQVELVPGTYQLATRVASLPGGGAYTISLNGNPIASDSVAATGGWQVWQTHELADVVITTAGTYTLRLDITAGNFNLNYIDLNVDSVVTPVDSDGDGIADSNDACPNEYAETTDGCPITQPSTIRIEAEDYSAYADSGSGNNGGEYRNDDVDIQTTSDTDGSYNVGWTDSGEWLEYKVNLAAGTYQLTARVASPNHNAAYSISVNGSAVASETAPSTGGWQSWQTQDLGEFTVATSGEQTLRVDINTGGFNLNYIELASD